MHSAVETAGGGRWEARRWRRLAAVAGAAVLVSGGSVLAASPASAATGYIQSCDTYHSWTECVSFDYDLGNLAVNALNGYSTTQTESLWISVYTTKIDIQAFDIPSGSWRGFPYHYGSEPPVAEVCAGIDNVQIVCTTFPIKA